MTRAFPWSRLAEIAQAPDIERLPFPGAQQVQLIRSSLGRLRAALAPFAAAKGKGGGHAPPPPKVARLKRR